MIRNNLIQNNNVFILNQVNSCRKKQIPNNNSVSFGLKPFSNKIPGIPCPYCKRRMFTGSEIKEFTRSIPDVAAGAIVRINGVKRTALQTIEEYTKQLKGVPRRVAELLVEGVRAFPAKPISQVIRDLADWFEPRLIDQQVEIFRKMHLEAQKLSKKRFFQVRRVVPYPERRALFGLSDKVRQEVLKRKNIIADLQNLRSAYANDQTVGIYNNLVRLAESLPDARHSYHAFIVKYGNRSPGEFLEAMLKQQKTTADHVHPRKLVGTPGKHWLVGCCNDCNGRKGDMGFDKWLKKAPVREVYFLDHLAYVDALARRKANANIARHLANAEERIRQREDKNWRQRLERVKGLIRQKAGILSESICSYPQKLLDVVVGTRVEQPKM